MTVRQTSDVYRNLAARYDRMFSKNQQRCDFVHTEQERSFHHDKVKIKIRLLDFWQKALREAGFSTVQFYGSWSGEPYSKDESRRLIAVASK